MNHPKPENDPSVDRLRRKVEEYRRWFRTLDRQIRVLERERQKFSAVVNHAGGGFIVLDRTGKVVWANEVFRQTFSSTEGAGLLKGLSCNQVLCGCDEICEGCPAPRTFRSGSVAHHEMNLELQGRTRHVYATAMAVHSPEGKVEECIIMVQDISDLQILRESEEALRVSEERFRSMFENVAAGMHACKPDGKFLQANPAFCRMLGYTASELLESKTVCDVTHPDDLEQMERQIDEVKLGKRRVMEMEKRYLHKDGGIVWARTTAVWLLDQIGKPDYCVALVENITERKRAQEELLQSQKGQREAEEALRQRDEQLRQAQKMEAIGRLAGGIAHDFNNLLTAIAGYGGLLLKRIDEHDPLRREVMEISKAADRAATLTGQLLAFSRRQILTPKVLDLNADVSDMDAMLRRVIGEDIDLVTELHPELSYVRADPVQIQQVLLNLVVNARDAMPHGGKITIQTANAEFDAAYVESHPGTRPGPYVMLSVTDTGCGMDEETKAKLFEPFFTTKEKGKGTGLGLSTVYGIIKQSGGNIWVYSEVGRGTTFKIYLPRIDEAPTESREPQEAYAGAYDGSETILLVEDDDAVRCLAQEILEEAGYTVLAAGNGTEAVSLSESYQSPIQLLVTDLVMPLMGGAELVNKLAPTRPDMSVLFISGYTDSAVFHQGLLKPGSYFIQKPFSPDTLSAKVREVLDSRSNETRSGEDRETA